MTSFPFPPSKRALNKGCYFRRNSSTVQRISDKLEPHNSCSEQQNFSENTTTSSVYAIESVATSKFYKELKTALLNSNYCQSVVFCGANCGLSTKFNRSPSSICGHFGSEYFKHSDTVNILLPPRFFRMTHEQPKTNSEQFTKNHEALFGMVRVPHGSRVNADSDTVATESKEHIIETTSYRISHENVRDKKSAFVPVGYNASQNTLRNGLLNNLDLGQKRKLLSLKSENLVSGKEFYHTKEKRFKSDEPKSTYERSRLYDELNQPFHFGEKSIYRNPASYKKNVYSTLNGLNEFSAAVPRKLNVLSKDMSIYLGEQEARIDQKEMGTSNSGKNFMDLKNSNWRCVGEASIPNCVSEKGDVSCPENIPRRTNQIYEENFANHSQEFISLDSTKSSFLTLIQDMRQNVESYAIPCPFCSKIFSKYEDLKFHVQTHNDNVSGNKTRKYEQSLCANQSAVSTHGNASMLTPVSSPVIRSPHPPSRRLGIVEDHGMTRATSVIQFAEKK